MNDDPTQVYHPGLEGVIAGESAICQVHAEAVLLYRGYDVHELAGTVPFESVAYLLLHGKLPSEVQAAQLRQEMHAALALPGPVLQMLHSMPRGAHPMDMLRTGVSMASTFDEEAGDNSHEANMRKAARLAGIANGVVAAAHAIRTGRDIGEPRQDLSLTGNFFRMAFGKEPEPWREQTLDTMYTLYAEHDFNASTFAARVIASTLSDIHSAVVGAIGALKGPLHGGANEEAMQVLRDAADAEDAAAWLKGKLERHQKVMGFGHRVYKKGDSRVPILRELTRRAGERLGQTHWVEVGEVLEKAMMETKGIPANADLYAAPLFHLLGIPSDLNTPLFACSRVVGWCAHVIEQHENNRLIRPRSRYVGPARRKL